MCTTSFDKKTCKTLKVHAYVKKYRSLLFISVACVDFL